nr:unnamed protein product [Digitaria exilis]
MCEHSRGRRSTGYRQQTRRPDDNDNSLSSSCGIVIRGRSMASSSSSSIRRGGRRKDRPGVPATMAVSLVPFLLLLLVSTSSAAMAASAAKHGGADRRSVRARARAAFRSRDEWEAYRKIMARMSPDGDIIHCVPCHRQPAFDHPKLRGQKPEDEPVERPVPKGGGGGGAAEEEEGDVYFRQAWSDGGERCPEGTVPIRRTTAQDVMRSSSARRFGMKKPRASNVRRDSTSDGHEHAVGYVTGDMFYGAKASLNVWSAKVASAAEFSLSQIWVISGSFGNDLNTIEAGWQVSPELYGDSNPRFFTYWTTDAYQATGCYNLHCSGFVQTNNRIAMGAAISPTSVYNGRQFDISLLIWKDPHRGNWWLQLGSGPLVGYWPSFLFTHLGGHANMVQFGGEVVNSRPSGSHTPTQMGSGHFPREGFNRAAYFRNVQVVDGDNSLVPAAALRLVADHPGCYDIQGGYNRAWGNYFYYGGPGRNVHCP